MRTCLVLSAVSVPVLWALPLVALAQPCPQITSPPISQYICLTASPTLSIAATGGEPLSYQWQVLYHANSWTDIAEGEDVLGGNDVGGLEFWAHSQGSTSPQLHISGINPLAAGGFLAHAVTFRCVVSNSCGATTSPDATLTICRVDSNCDGLFTPADVAAFINTWFSSVQQGTLAGDYDRDGTIVPADVASYVSAWFNAIITGNCGF